MTIDISEEVADEINEFAEIGDENESEEIETMMTSTNIIFITYTLYYIIYILNSKVSFRYFLVFTEDISHPICIAYSISSLVVDILSGHPIFEPNYVTSTDEDGRLRTFHPSMWTTDQNLGSDRPSHGQIQTLD